MSYSIWFWQRMISPHMAYLATAMAHRGHSVSYVAEEALSPERAAMGWQQPPTGSLQLRYATNSITARMLAEQAPETSIHITQGLRANGVIGGAQSVIRRRNLRHFIVIETVDTRGPIGPLKTPLYAWNLSRWHSSLEGILAIGEDTPHWFSRLAPRLRIIPFAYFLPRPASSPETTNCGPFTFLYVGSLVALKRVDLLLERLALLQSRDFVLEIVGDGPLRRNLEALAEKLLPDRVIFHGTVGIDEVPRYMAAANCLVLPSDHDGWGAVISEALMVGTPVICSSACGAKGAVVASKQGGVFYKNNPCELDTLLKKVLEAGPLASEERTRLRQWASCLDVQAGAEYLEKHLNSSNFSDKIYPPWENWLTNRK